jgi:hypothetical protein
MAEEGATRQDVERALRRLEPRSWTFNHFERTWTINIDRNWHPYKRAAVIKEWRGVFCILGLAEPTCQNLDRVRIEATPLLPEVGGAMNQDVGACFPAVKAAIDGLVDAGMCENDGPKHVVSLTFNVQRRGGRYAGLELVVTEVL